METGYHSGPGLTRPRERNLLSWANTHAAALLLATLVALSVRHLWLVFATGGISFLALILLRWKKWTNTKSLGAANTVTLLRLMGILFVWAVPAPWVPAVGLILVIADGVDGWIARRRDMRSHFGDYFDKETDAFFLLILCLLAISRGLLPSWILVAGILRYTLVVLRWLVRPEILSERKSQAARVIYIAAMVGLLICYLPFPRVRVPVAAFVTLLLIYSFAGDFRQVFSPE